VRLIVYSTTKARREGANPFKLGTAKCCAFLKTGALLTALAEGAFDASIGGARRDEEKSRAKERIYSFRDPFGQWDPKNQRPEPWNLYNGRVNNPPLLAGETPIRMLLPDALTWLHILHRCSSVQGFDSRRNNRGATRSESI